MSCPYITGESYLQYYSEGDNTKTYRITRGYSVDAAVQNCLGITGNQQLGRPGTVGL